MSNEPVTYSFCTELLPFRYTVKNDEPEGYHGDRDSAKIDHIQQISEPDDIGNVVTFLASDLSKAVNAQMLLVSVIQSRKYRIIP